jgi:hypothetical protein
MPCLSQTAGQQFSRIQEEGFYCNIHIFNGNSCFIAVLLSQAAMQLSISNQKVDCNYFYNLIFKKAACWLSFPGQAVLQLSCRKSYLCILFLGIALPQSQFPNLCVCERIIYSQDRSSYFLLQNRQMDRGNI